jgi:hypothetical protein
MANLFKVNSWREKLDNKMNLCKAGKGLFLVKEAEAYLRIKLISQNY